MVLGILILILGISLIVFELLINNRNLEKETIAIENYFINNSSFNDNDLTKVNNPTNVQELKYNYIAVLEIPSINLKKGLVNIDNFYNNINYNVEIIKGSELPDVSNGNLVLAAHSGNSNISFFKNLYKLKTNNNIYIYYNNKIYTYKIFDEYQIDKTGQLKYLKENNKRIITLITCIPNTNKQLVKVGELVSIN